MQRVLSGIQPTGNLHLGNYLGAIRNWVAMQQDMPCLFMIADLHAITVQQDPAALIHATREITAALIACGVDPARSIIFAQSSVRGHAELAWILNCHTPLGWLNRMTQFKEKSGKNKESAMLGLYSYPVLQTADILIYQATHVPVGEDQKQHIELSRDIAGAFNRAYSHEFFTLPEPIIQKQSARIMSLRDGTKKMSKSDESDYSRINLTDDADTIAKKIKKAKSDVFENMRDDLENRPEAHNLMQIYAALSNLKLEHVISQFGSGNFSTFKAALAEVAVTHLSPITARMNALMANRDAIDAVLKDGAARANAIAEPTLAQVKKMVGFWRE